MKYKNISFTYMLEYGETMQNHIPITARMTEQVAKLWRIGILVLNLFTRFISTDCKSAVAGSYNYNEFYTNQTFYHALDKQVSCLQAK